MTKSTKTKEEAGAERRRSKRMDILDTFSLYAVVPTKGPMRLKVHDISDLGIGFDLDVAEERGAQSFQLKLGASVDIQLYLNQTLYLPLTVQARRISDRDGIRKIGAEFQGHGSKAYIALISFLDMLDAVSEATNPKS